MASTVDIEAALASVISTLDADGYDLAVAGNEASVCLTVIARPEACADCLVPSELFAAMVKDQLDGCGLTPEVEVVYPENSAAPH